MDKPSPLGFGLGLRPVYYEDILERNPKVDWFEVLSENYMVPGGRPLAMLERIRADYPIVMHGVSMSIASTAPLEFEYLKALRELAERFQPEWIFGPFVLDRRAWREPARPAAPFPTPRRRWTISSNA